MLLTISLALLTSAVNALPSIVSLTPLPLVIWHGLGDKFDNEGLQSVGELATQVYPGTYVHYVALGETGDDDRKATFFGNVSMQIDQVCETLHNLSSTLSHTVEETLRIDALGFSQGGQFLRGLVERCDGLSVRSLVTFGSQHNGIAEFSRCGTWDLLCKGALGLVGGSAFSEWVQGNVVPAQYYRKTDPETGLAVDDYLLASHFLADVNNERTHKNEVYKDRIAAMDNFVMYVFDNDTTVIPKESGWFAEVNTTSGEITPLRQRMMYAEDWIGLRQLDRKGGLQFRRHTGNHMQLEDVQLTAAFKEFFGPERRPKHADHEEQLPLKADL